MNNKSSNVTSTAIRAAMGIAFVSGSMAAPLSATAENPFVANDLGSGYQLASNHAEGKCGEGKCGGDGEKSAEGKCGDSGEKSAEGKCGASGEKSAEGKCGGDGEKSAEGKCGEGKCGA